MVRPNSTHTYTQGGSNERDDDKQEDDAHIHNDFGFDDDSGTRLGPIQGLHSSEGLHSSQGERTAHSVSAEDKYPEATQGE